MNNHHSRFVRTRRVPTADTAVAALLGYLIVEISTGSATTRIEFSRDSGGDSTDQRGVS